MKASDIVVGDIYSDGKQALRKVIAKRGCPTMVVYVLLASKVERSFNSDGVPVTLLGVESEVTFGSFASWARVRFNPTDGARHLLGLQAAKLKLSAGELAYLVAIRRTVPQDVPNGMRFKYDHTAGRAVGGLERKGLLKRRLDHQVELTDLGVARLLAIDARADELK